MALLFLIVFFLGFPLPHLCAEEVSTPAEASADDRDLCSFLKDVQAKADADCSHGALTALKTQNPAAYFQQVELARRRKSEVLKAYGFLKSQPAPETTDHENTGPDGTPDSRHYQRPPPGSSNQSQSPPTQLQPPINGRTFPAWIGPAAKDLKEVYARWLQVQSQELQQEKENPVSPERKKEIDAALAANQAKIRTLGRIKDPEELSCFFGENCGTGSGATGPTDQPVLGTKRGGWAADDYRRANEEEVGRGVRVPGGKIDRGVPSFSMVASEVVDSSPLGPLKGNAGDGQDAALGAVATMALATTGALLLFGGLGGRKLEEKFPNIRRDMGIAAAVTGTIAIGASALPSVARMVYSPQTIPATIAAERALAGPAKTPVSFALTKGEARGIISNMQLPIEQARSALTAIKRATTSSSFRITREAEEVVIRTARSGRNGYQLFEYRIAADGKKIPVQTAYDAAGKLVHYDPK